MGEPLTGHSAVVRSVAYSHDGAYIVSGSADNTLRFWAAGTGEPLGVPLTGHDEVLTGVAFSPDGHRVVSSSQDRTLRLWPAPTAWPELLCDKITANMSRQQWRDWVSPDIGYRTVCPGLPISPG